MAAAVAALKNTNRRLPHGSFVSAASDSSETASTGTVAQTPSSPAKAATPMPQARLTAATIPSAMPTVAPSEKRSRPRTASSMRKNIARNVGALRTTYHRTPPATSSPMEAYLRACLNR